MSGASLAFSTTNILLLLVTTSDDQAAAAHYACVPVATATQPTRLTVPYSTSPAVNSHRWGMSGASLAFSTTNTPLLHVTTSDDQAATAHSACVPVATATQPTRLTVSYSTSPAHSALVPVATATQPTLLTVP